MPAPTFVYVGLTGPFRSLLLGVTGFPRTRAIHGHNDRCCSVPRKALRPASPIASRTLWVAAPMPRSPQPAPPGLLGWNVQSATRFFHVDFARHGASAGENNWPTHRHCFDQISKSDSVILDGVVVQNDETGGRVSIMVVAGVPGSSLFSHPC